MKFFDLLNESYLIEAVNKHMTHITDLVFDEGKEGAKKAIRYLEGVKDEISGHGNKEFGITVKWDGAPAVFAGKDPEDGKFFVAKKGIFAKNPKIYKSHADIDADTDGDLNKKLTVAFDNLKKIGIDGIYQGDIMFTKGDLKKEKIDGEDYITFQPNTIVYAVPAESDLAKEIQSAEIGVAWHTTYTGDSIKDLTASFGKSIASNFKKVKSVWSVDAEFRDETGNATFTQDETDECEQKIADAKNLLSKIDDATINLISDDEELRAKANTFNNSRIRIGKELMTDKDATEFAEQWLDYIHGGLDIELSKFKTVKKKQEVMDKYNEIFKKLNSTTRRKLVNVFKLIATLVNIKMMIVSKLNQASYLSCFLRTNNGLKVTAPEGFVAIDHLSGNGYKLVDRLGFSAANFGVGGVIRGWEK